MHDSALTFDMSEELEQGEDNWSDHHPSGHLTHEPEEKQEIRHVVPGELQRPNSLQLYPGEVQPNPGVVAHQPPPQQRPDKEPALQDDCNPYGYGDTGGMGEGMVTAPIPPSSLSWREHAALSGMTVPSPRNSSSRGGRDAAAAAEWNIDAWPPILGGWRWYHSSLVLHRSDYLYDMEPDDEYDTSPPVPAGTTNTKQRPYTNFPDTLVLLLGGYQEGAATASTVVLDPAKRQFVRAGPSMTQARTNFATVRCGGGAAAAALYAIGGMNGTASLDTLEYLTVDYTALVTGGAMTDAMVLNSSAMMSDDQSVASHKSTGTTTAHDPSLSSSAATPVWTRLFCRLSMPRSGCAAVSVHNRYIIVMGGGAQNDCSVDIVDTHLARDQELSSGGTSNLAAVVPGPPMSIDRRRFGAAVVGNEIWIVGGRREDNTCTNSVASLEFHATPPPKRNKDPFRALFASFAWKERPDLSLPVARCGHGLTVLGHCLVVAGGEDNGHSHLSSVQVVIPNATSSGACRIWLMSNVAVPS